MFDFVIKHKRLLQFLLALLLIPPFAFFGIQSFDRMRSGGTDLAEVDGTRISGIEFSRAVEQQRDQLRSALGRNFDPALLDSPQARKEMLDNLVLQRVLGTYMARNNLVVTNDQIRELIMSEPAFHEDGKFSRSRYQALIRAQNRTEEQFEADLRSELLRRQIGGAVYDGAIVSKATTRRLAAIRGESREVAESFLPAAQFFAQVKLAPDAVENYYKANGKEFETPERIRAEYVELSQESMLAEETVSADEVRAAYEANQAPRRRDRLEARKKAEALLAEVRKDPARFAELAKASSQDPGSAAQGGDLGWFGRGAMVKPFEAAVFKLKENEIGPLVETEFGFHVVRVTGIRKTEGGKGEERRASHILITAPGEVKEFEAARAEIESELKRQRLLKRFPELAETFSNMAYEQPDSLRPLADKFKLKVGTTDWFARGKAPEPLNNPKLTAALFGDDAVRNRRNTEAVEVAPGRLVVARVLEHQPAAIPPLDEVRAEIVRRLTEEEGARLAREAGATRLKALQAGQGAGVTWGPPRVVSRDSPGGVDRRAIPPIFRADASKLPAYVGVDLSPSGYSVFRVSRASPAPAPDDARLRAGEAGLARLEGREAYQALLDSLRGRAKVEIFEANLAKQRER